MLVVCASLSDPRAHLWGVTQHRSKGDIIAEIKLEYARQLGDKGVEVGDRETVDYVGVALLPSGSFLPVT